MSGWIKKTILAVVGLAVAAGAGWMTIGPDWRALLKNPPLERDVLFWSQDQRDTGFRMMDRLPLIIKSRDIQAGGDVRELPVGEPIDLGVDLAAYMKEQNAASLVVLHNEKVRAEAYGLGFSVDERWTSFSVGKSLTSTLVGAAIKDGYIISIDDPVTAYIPDLEGSGYDGVTIRQVLTMTSGVDWVEDYDDPTSDVAMFSTHIPEGDMTGIVSYMRGLKSAHPPGTKWNYSTGETNLIGVIVSAATGKNISDYLSEKIWRPYGMQQKATWLFGDDGVEMSGCCIQATTRDFARFGQFILEGGVIDGESILPEGWLDAATHKQVDYGAEGEGYGYQWWTWDDGSFQADGIFGQGIFIDPARNLVIASNASWTTALGHEGGEFEGRAKLYRAVQAAIDAEQTR